MTKRDISRILRGAAALCAAALCAAGCIYERPDDAGAAGRTLALKVAMLDAGPVEDADPDDAASGVERMHDLRVVVTTWNDRGSEYVEYNRYIKFDGAAGEYKCSYLEDRRLEFRIRKEGRHRIYLFANCETLFSAANVYHHDPEGGLPGDVVVRDPDIMASQTYLESLRRVTYTNAQLQAMVADGTGIPMSAEREVLMNDDPTFVQVLDAYIVRACNKITFSYENSRPTNPVFIQSWSLNYVADKAYLLARVTGGHETDWITWYANHIGAIGDGVAHGTELEFSVPPADGIATLTKTYADLSDDNTDAAGRPVGGGVETVTGLKVQGRNLDLGQNGTAEDMKVYYFPETRYLVDGRESYAIAFGVKEWGVSSWETKNYGGVSPIPLDQVTTLFRNTHVRIKVKLEEGDRRDLEVSVINWATDDFGYGEWQ